MTIHEAHPLRIQRKRTKGWRMPDGAVYVGRPSKWGNPWPVTQYRPVASSMMLYRAHIESLVVPEYGSDLDLKELRGRQLACWCPLDRPCHADILAEIANDLDTTKHDSV